MRKGLPYFVLLFSLLIAFSGVDAYGQGRENGGKKNDLPPVLRGQEGTIDDLDNAYCESSSSPEIYVNPGNLPDPADYDFVVWELYYYDGGGNPVYRNDFLNPIGAAPNNGVELDVNQIASEGLFDSFLVIEYSFRRGLGTFGGDFDFTIIRKDPSDFNLSIDQSAICLGETATLTLDGSESGYLYYLYRDGVLQNTVGRNGNGNPINFIQSSLPEGDYSYYVVAHVDDADVTCETQMSGTPSLSVNSVPSANPVSSNSPVCQDIAIELADGNPVVSGFIYTWYGPGLDPSGVTGHSISVTDPAVIGTPGDYDYDLTIVDSNNPTGCTDTSSVTVTVLERPAVAPTNDGPVCDGATNVGLYANPSGGSGDYSFSWTSNPAGFTSSDENPVLAAVTYGVDDIEYIVDVTDNVTGCVASSTGSTNLVIHENPSVVIPEGDQTVCQEQDVTYTTNVSGSGTYTYQWYLDGNPISGETASSLTITGAGLPAVGNHSVSVEVIDTSTGTNCSSTESVQLTVNEKPEVEIVGPLEACAGDNITFDANLLSGPGAFPGDYTITWTTPYGSESGDSFNINNVSDATHSGTYTLNIVYDATGCADQVQIDLIVHTVTPGISANPGTEVCQGSQVEFTGTGGTNYEFLIDDGTGYSVVQGMSADDTFGPVTLNDGDLVKVLVEDANGCQAESSPLTMIVNELPVIDDIGNNGPYCIDDDPIELYSSVSGGDISVSGDYIYSWSGPNGFTSNVQDPSFGPATSDRAGIYSLTITDDNGCVSVVDDTEVIVNSLPSPSATNTGPVCGNGNNNITLVGDPDGLVAYEWYDPDDILLGSVQDYTINNVLPDDSGMYTLRVSDANGCENITTTEVIVNEIPVVSIGPDQAACETSDVTLTATISSATSGPYTYSWYKDDGGGPVQVASGIDLDTYTLTSVDNTDEATYSVVVNDGNGCASASDAMILTINPLPSVSPSGSDICASPNNDILLEGGPDDPDYTYSWSGPGLAGSVSGQDVTVTDDATTSTPNIYTYTLTTESLSTGCSNSANVDVEVFENPLVTVDPVSPICDGGSFTVTANASGGSGDFSFSWTFTPEGGGASSALPFVSNTFDVDPADLNDAGTYEVTVLDNITGCTTIGNVVVTVNELPTVTVDDVSTCDGNDATLTAVSAGGSGNYVNYIWSDGGGVIAGENNSTLVLTGADVALANNGANYSVTVEDDNGCVSASDNMTLTVNENPSVQINSGDPDIDVCVGANLTLTANVTGGSGSNSFVWNLPDGSTQTGSPLIIDPVSLADQGVYTVTVSDGVSCEGTAQVQVNVHEVNPALSASSTEICDGSSVTFTAGGGAQYEFLLNGVVEQALSATDNWTSSSLSDGDEVTVRVVDTYGCEAVSAPITMTVNANPVVSLSVTSPNGDTPCIGQTVEFTATPGFFNYVYYVDGTEVQNSSNNIFTTDAINDGAVVYVVAESNEGCSGTSGNQTINFDPLPIAGISSDQPSNTACPHELVSFTASGGDAYEFLVDGVSAGAASNDATFTQNAPASGSMEVGVIVTDANSCSDTAYVDIIVSEVVPILNATATTICVGNKVTFTAGGGDQYEFFLNGSSIGAPSSVNTYVTNTLADGDQVYVRVIDQYGCENSSSPIAMTVNDNPTVSLSFPGGPNEVCQNSDLVVEATSGYSNYVFFVNGVEVQNSASNIYTSNTFANNDEIYVSASSGVGCSADSNPETIIVHSLPNATASNSGPACEGQTISLLGGDAGLSYEWFAPGDDPAVDSPISTSMDYDLTGVTLGQAGIYTLVVTDGNSCQSSATTDVVVNDLPVVDLGSDIAVCNGTQNYDLSANISGGLSPYNVEWEFEGTSVLSGQDENVYSIANVDNSHEGEYVVTVTDANSCVSVKDTVYLTVNPSPSVSFDLGNSTYEVCDGSQVTLSAQGSGGVVSGNDPSLYEYVWYYDGNLLPGVSTQNYSFTGQNGINDGLYEVVAVDDNGNGCTSSAQQIDVVVYQLPSATLDADPAFFIEGTNVDFTAGGGDEYTFYLNGTEVRSRGVDNTWSSNTLVDGDSVSVEVYENHGSFYCKDSTYIIMSVFEDVDQPVVDVTNSEYCSGDGGATVDVTNPQNGVTYEIVLGDETPTSYSAIVYDGSTPVQLTNVTDANVPTGTNFRVKAHWDMVPDNYQVSDVFRITEHEVPVLHTLTVDGTAVPVPNGSTVNDCNAGSGYVIGLEDSWSSDEYVLLLNGSQELERKVGGPTPFVFDNAYSMVGEYSIIAVSSNGCQSTMEGTFTIEGEDVEQYDVLPVDGRYCEDGIGIDISLASSEVGVDYELLRDGTSLTTITGDGNPIQFGNFTTEGTYRVVVTSSGGCTYLMNNDVVVSIVSNPVLDNLSATNNGHFCPGGTGVDITLDVLQETGVDYELYDVDTGNTIGSLVTGTDGGGPVTFVSDFTTEGRYQVRASVQGLGCQTLSNEIEIIADPLPNSFNVQLYAEMCGSAGTAVIGLDTSEADVEYRWVNSSTNGAWVSGTGNSIEFEVADADSYQIEARRTGTLTMCSILMNGTAEVIERPLPDPDVSVSSTTGTACDDGAVITIDNPQAGVNYQLFKYDLGGNQVFLPEIIQGVDPSTPISFSEVVDKNSEYFIEATDQVYGCQNILNTSVNVDIAGALERHALLPDEADICNGDSGLEIELEDSESGIDYVLVLAGATASENDTLETVTGTGDALTFSAVLEEGEYFVVGLSPVDGSCDNEMLNRVNLNVRPLPTSFNMIGPGAFCDGVGATLGVDNSQSGVTYVLQQHTSLGKRNIDQLTGIGDTITFIPVTEEYVYSVVAISEYGCTSSMKDSIEVKALSSPGVPEIDDDTIQYCSIDFTTNITLTSNVVENAVYQVFDPDSVLVTEGVAGTGDLELGPLTEGKYVIRSSWVDGACISAASDTVWVLESTQPIVSGGLNYEPKACAGDSIAVTYDNSMDDQSWTYSIVDSDYNVVFSESDAIDDGSSLTWYLHNSGDYFVEVSSGICGLEYSSRIQLEFSAPLIIPQAENLTYNYCHDYEFVDIGVQSGGGNSILFHLYDAETMTELAGISPVYSGTTPVFEDVPQGTYIVRSEDLANGCLSDLSDTVAVEPFVLPTDTVFWYDLTGTTTNIEYLAGGQVALNLDLSVLDSGFDYIVKSQSDETATFDVNDGNGQVEISQRGDDYFTYGIYSDQCPAYPVTLNALSVREDSIDAKDVHLYLSEGENSDTISVQVAHTDFDEGYLEYFFLNEDTTISIGLVGDYYINPNTGFVTFDKAPSFYGTDRIEYVVRNSNYPERVDTAYIYVYVGNSTLSDDKAIFIPNAFSPNDDSKNDFFVIESNNSITEESSLEVYNRWGTIVYRSDGKNYENDWDGTSNQNSMVSIGQDLPNGVYFYVYTITANVDGKIVNKKFNGYIELRR